MAKEKTVGDTCEVAGMIPVTDDSFKRLGMDNTHAWDTQKLKPFEEDEKYPTDGILYGSGKASAKIDYSAHGAKNLDSLKREVGNSMARAINQKAGGKYGKE